jgi:outer membrane protein OmpA-like peptidoglycan-associated protein
MNKKKTLTFFLLPLIVAGCSNMSRTAKGGWIGGASGAVLGGVIGKQAGNTAAGAIIGAALGGAAGASIGHYMDKQAEELQRDLRNARVERVGEGIQITFNSGILFDTDSTLIKNDAKTNLNDLAKTLNKYADTNIVVEGHTDSLGRTRYNQELSEDRAEAVSNYLQSQNVMGQRIRTSGKGEEQPAASNETEEGRAANRRVEVAIFANEKLKKAAEDGKI